MKTFKDFSEIEKEEIIAFAKTNGYTVAQNKYGIWAETIRYHADKKYKEFVKKKSNQRHIDNKDNAEYKMKRKEMYQKRLESGKGPQKWKEWYEKNKDRSSANSKRHRRENLERYKEMARQRYLTKEKQENREKYKNDFVFKLKANIREALRRALKYGNTSKDSPSIIYLGCSIEEFKVYIQEQFQSGMTWDNHGRGENCWHLDHIKPLNLLKEGTFTLEELCHYTNYQPLWEKDNLSKNCKYEQ